MLNQAFSIWSVTSDAALSNTVFSVLVTLNQALSSCKEADPSCPHTTLVLSRRFGAQEWEELIDSDSELEHVTREVPSDLQYGLESLEEHGTATLRLRFHAIRWAR